MDDLIPASATPSQLARLLELALDDLQVDHVASDASESPGEASGSPICRQVLPDCPPSGPGEGGTPPEGRALPPVPPSSSLDTQETSEGIDYIQTFLAEKPAAKVAIADAILDETSLSARFRHSGWAHDRRRVMASMKRCEVSGSRQWAFAICGSGSWVEHNIEAPDRLRIRQNNCHDRLCVPCAHARSQRIHEALNRMIGATAITFITLTLQGKGETLNDLIDKLMRSFRALRSAPLWESNVSGGAAFLEIKWSSKSSRWHPHLHIVCEAGYMPQYELSDLWRGITRDSYIVHISKERNPEKVMRYVTKYASKPLDGSFTRTPGLLDEALVALKGRRLCTCFGSWYGTALSDAEDVELGDDLIDAGEWAVITTLEHMLMRALDHDDAARSMLAKLGIENRFYVAIATPPPPANC
jgi:hypothetical protein